LLPPLSISLPLPGAGGFHRAAEYVITRGVNNLVLFLSPFSAIRDCVRVRLISSILDEWPSFGNLLLLEESSGANCYVLSLLIILVGF